MEQYSVEDECKNQNRSRLFITSVEDALEGAVSAHVSLPPALAKKIIAGADYLKIAPTLVRVARNAPLPKVDLSVPKSPGDLSAIYQFKERYALGAKIRTDVAFLLLLLSA